MITSKRRQIQILDPHQLPAHFDDPRLFSEDTITTIIDRMCDDVNSRYSNRIKWCLKYKAWDKLLDMDVHPSEYTDALEYFKDAQVYALVKKYPEWHTSHDPELNAKKTFLACEARCRDTNQRFWTHEPSSWAVHSVLAIAQRKISNILGDVPSIHDLSFRFGPGASYSVKYNTSALNKLASSIDVTPSCYAIKDEIFRSCPGWRPAESFDICGPIQPPQVTVVSGDRLSFVPKTAKTHRPIGINPLLNGLIQKGYGAVIRNKLRPYIDLNKTQPIHRKLAQSASKTGHLATIDLSAASDTIAYAFVQDMLPNQWFDALHTVRSPQYNVENNWYTYQKFSAMGNGFTFELETLLFYALAAATAEHLGECVEDVSVYGDDIIVPTACTSLLKRVLTYCGFELNAEKSFFEGPFRESCGGDYFNGLDVRPFYLKDRISYRTLFLLRNFMEVKGWRYMFS